MPSHVIEDTGRPHGARRCGKLGAVDPASRLLKLLSLLQFRRAWSGADLAARLEVTGRTLRRDVERLRNLGYPVDSTSGVAGGYQLGAGARLPPLLLDDDEALAVVFGLHGAASGAISGIEEVALSALRKLNRILPAKVRRNLELLTNSVSTVRMGSGGVDPEHLSLLAAGCQERRQVAFAYVAGDGQRTQRNVDPHGLVNVGARWYLAAYDPARSAFRTFRVDRMGTPALQDAAFVPRTPPEGDLVRYVVHSVGDAAMPYQATVEFLAPLAAVSARLPRGAGDLRPLDAERCVLHTRGRSLREVALQLLMLEMDFIVRAPPELTEQLQHIAATATRATESRCPAGP